MRLAGGMNGGFFDGFINVINSLVITAGLLAVAAEKEILGFIKKILDFIDIIKAYEEHGICGLITQVILIVMSAFLVWLYVLMFTMTSPVGILALEAIIGASFQDYMLSRGHPCE